MAIKSIVDIDIDPKGNFKAFSEIFDKYQKALAQSPAEWAKVTAKIGSSKQAFDALVKQQIAANAQTRLLAEASKAADIATRTMGDRWREIGRTTSAVSRDFKSMATNLKDATLSLVKWASVTTVVSGLLGVGGLFGLDRLAGSVGNNRRTSLGLGGTYGGTQSFGVNFGRLVDGGQFLSNVANAKFDVGKRVGLYSAGLSDDEINAPTEQTGAALLRQLAKIADENNPMFYSSVLQSRHLDQFADSQLLEAIHRTPVSEREQLFNGFTKDTGAFKINDSTARAYQDFETRLKSAGQAIENTFVIGIQKLIPGLTHLSEGTEKLVEAFLNSKDLKKWIDQAAEGLEKFAKFIGTDKFSADINDFVKGIGEMASTATRVARALGLISPAPSVDANGNEVSPKDPLSNMPGYDAGVKARKWLTSEFDPFGIKSSMRGGPGYGTRGDRNNNPGNIEYGRLARSLGAIGTDGRFAVFPNKEAGQAAMAALLQKNYSGLSLEQIEKKWVGNYDPNYIASMSKSTGLSPNQVPNLNDPSMMNKLMLGMSGGEGTHIRIHNNTGGNAVVSAAGASGAAAAVATATN